MNKATSTDFLSTVGKMGNDLIIKIPPRLYNTFKRFCTVKVVLLESESKKKNDRRWNKRRINKGDI